MESGGRLRRAELQIRVVPSDTLLSFEGKDILRRFQRGGLLKDISWLFTGSRACGAANRQDRAFWTVRVKGSGGFESGVWDGKGMMEDGSWVGGEDGREKLGWLRDDPGWRGVG